MPQSFIADGDIYPCRFVMPAGTTKDGRIVQATAATDNLWGISQQHVRRSQYVDTSGKAAAQNEPIRMFEFGEECYLELAGTVSQGSRLTADTNGKGVATTTDKDRIGAQALAAGVSGEIIPVKVLISDESV